MNEPVSICLASAVCQALRRHHRETDQWDAVPAMEGFSLVSLPTANKRCAVELGTGALRARRREGIAVGGQGSVGHLGNVFPRRCHRCSLLGAVGAWQ